MKNSIFLIFVVTILLVPYSETKANETVSNVEKNLAFVIAPTSEDQEEFIKTIKVHGCIAKAAYSKWPEEQYKELDSELNQYANKIQKVSVDPEYVLKNGYPKPSEKLNEYFVKLSEFVPPCEKKHGVNVEF